MDNKELKFEPIEHECKDFILEVIFASDLLKLCKNRYCCKNYNYKKCRIIINQEEG